MIPFSLYKYMCISVIIIIFFLNKYRNTKSQYLFNLAGFTGLLYWSYITVYMTILNRYPTAEAQIELRLFWCIREAWQYNNMIDWFLVIGNLVLFVPLGVFLTMFFTSMRRCGKVITIGILCSAVIETSQLIWHRGLFELDDLFNNTLGCLLGYGITLWVIGKKARKKINFADIMVCGFAWVIVIAVLIIALYRKQPVFDYFLYYFPDFMLLLN